MAPLDHVDLGEGASHLASLGGEFDYTKEPGKAQEPTW
jgi:hypothetical protein